MTKEAKDDVAILCSREPAPRGQLNWWERVQRDYPEFADRMRKIRKAYKAGKLPKKYDGQTLYEYCCDEFKVPAGTPQEGEEQKYESVIQVSADRFRKVFLNKRD